MSPSAVLETAGNVRALVVGDICLDRWCRYDPALSEPSRETGIPRRAVIASHCSPGAGGTVAANLSALGVGLVSVLGLVGCDGAAYELRNVLDGLGIDSSHLIADPTLMTFTYTKLINATSGAEDQPRVDFVNKSALSERLQDRLLGRFSEILEAYDVVVVADQAETAEGGSVTASVRSTICRSALRNPRITFVGDSRKRVEHFRHCIMTPNEEEAAAASGRVFGTSDFVDLQRLIGGPALIVTAGSRGAILVESGTTRLFPVPRTGPVVDECGAGDSLSAGMALALAQGASMDAALRFGMLVASVTVGKAGTGTAAPGDVLGMLLPDLPPRRSHSSALREPGGRRVVTGKMRSFRNSGIIGQCRPKCRGESHDRGYC